MCGGYGDPISPATLQGKPISKFGRNAERGTSEKLRFDLECDLGHIFNVACWTVGLTIRPLDNSTVGLSVGQTIRPLDYHAP